MFSEAKIIPVSVPEKGFGIYIHWPFCKAKCPYCDFNSYVQKQVDYDAFTRGFLSELSYYQSQLDDQTVTSIFFGGGTPSLMNPDQIETIIDHIQKNATVSSDVEITLEANPTSVAAGKFKDFANAGVNRVSIGVQSFNEEDLKFLGRWHSVDEAKAAIDLADQYFDRFSFDLIYARPKQTLLSWENELNEALQYAKGHLSLYQLTIEKGTAFYTQHQRGDFVIPESNLADQFYDVTEGVLNNHGLFSYEVSNYAAAGQESKHNLVYWRYGDYLGIGPGAHGRIKKEGRKYATNTYRVPKTWLEHVEQNGHGLQHKDELGIKDRAVELLMMGLRLKEGVFVKNFYQETGLDLQDFLPASKLRPLIEQGDVIFDSDRLALTFQGRKRLNSILSFLLA